MCYYQTIKNKGDLFIQDVQIQGIEKLLHRPIQSAFEYSTWPIIKSLHSGIEMAHWEFIPYWAKDWKAVEESRKRFTTMNAQGEKLLESKMYSEAARKRRCLILSTGFYEWRHFKPEGAKKEIAYPYHIAPASTNYFLVAGIWQPWTDKTTGETIDTFSMVTTAANDLMAGIHNKKKRQPTILTEELASAWLKELSDDRIELIASYQAPPSEMYAYTIAKEFRTLENPEEAYDYVELPTIC